MQMKKCRIVFFFKLNISQYLFSLPSKAKMNNQFNTTLGRSQPLRYQYFVETLLNSSPFNFHTEKQQRTCPELRGLLHHSIGQEGDQATLLFQRHTGFTHVNSMNSRHGILWKSKWPPHWLPFFSLLPCFLFAHSSIYTYMNTDTPVEVGQSWSCNGWLARL